MILSELNKFLNMIEDIHVILYSNHDDHSKLEKIKSIIEKERNLKIAQAAVFILKKKKGKINE